LKTKARQLRKNQTDAEKLLWSRLRRRQVGNNKFRRQHAIGPYIVDFVCLSGKLIIELDGGQHAEQAAYDERRTAFLESEGFKVLRFWNTEVLMETEAVLEVIYKELVTRTPHL
jgi:adenine-specific DNA-methyltransferase